MRNIDRLAAALAVAVMLPASALAQTTLIFNSYLPPFDPLHQIAVTDFAARIEQESQGAIKVTIPDSSMAPSDRQYEMVRDGIADMAIIASGTVPQQLRLFRIADLPLHSPSGVAASHALWATYRQHLEPLAEFDGLKVLGVSVLPGRQLMTLGDLKIAGPEDLRGVKLWTPPGTLMATASALGAVPINTEFTDLQEYVTKGNVDAMIMSPGSAHAARVLEHAGGMTLIPGGLGSLSFAVAISQERWDSLTDAERAAIGRAAEGLSERIGAAFDAFEAAAEPPFAAPEAVSGPELDAFAAILSRQIEEWKAMARERGVEDPDEVLAFYRDALEP